VGFRCGIVGLPNVGKSTLYNALTSTRVPAENYPFCTIDPNLGVVAVPDARLERIAAIAGSPRVVPATMEFVDIAGLVAGASRGEGLGNQFLAHIRECHAIAHVVRLFDDADVVHVSGRVDPKHDIEVVATELLLADLQTVERALERAARAAKSGEPERRAQAERLERIARHLDEGKPARTLEGEAERALAGEALHLLSAKPVLYVANVSELGAAGEREALAAIETIAAREGARVVPLCARLEAELAALDARERAEFLAELGLEEPGLARVIRAGYALLGLETFFTAGPKEARAWTIPAGATAVEAAGRIHSDFARGFIRAEVASYEDFVACGGEQGARDAGRLRSEGRDYRVRDGDVIHFRFNV